MAPTPLLAPGSAHGTFVAGTRAIPFEPVELDVGCKLRFAESTRVYVLRRAVPDAVHDARGGVQHRPSSPLPPRPDPADEEAVLQFNTLCNKKGMYPDDEPREAVQGNPLGDAGQWLTSANDGQDDAAHASGGVVDAHGGGAATVGKAPAGMQETAIGDASVAAAGVGMSAPATSASGTSVTSATGSGGATTAHMATAAGDHKPAPKGILRKKRPGPPPLPPQSSADASYASVFNPLAGRDVLREAAGAPAEVPAAKRLKPAVAMATRRRISFRDEMGGQLVEELGGPDARGGADDDGVIVGPIEVKAGEQQGKYANLMTSTVIMPAGRASKAAATVSTAPGSTSVIPAPSVDASKDGAHTPLGQAKWAGAAAGNTQAAFLKRVQTLLHPSASTSLYSMLPPLSVPAPPCPPTPVGSALPKADTPTSER
eukprot:jgi/Mesvir1/23142/Mv10530-RA.2